MCFLYEKCMKSKKKNVSSLLISSSDDVGMMPEEDSFLAARLSETTVSCKGSLMWP